MVDLDWAGLLDFTSQAVISKPGFHVFDTNPTFIKFSTIHFAVFFSQYIRGKSNRMGSKDRASSTRSLGFEVCWY